MRRLTKSEPPAILTSNEEAWRKEFEDHVASNGGTVGRSAPARYGHPALRQALRKELLNKCAYCESHIPHISFDHIEHILPKSRRPDLVVSWINLTLACPICNHEKGHYYEPSQPLIHPYNDDPEAEIHFAGPMARAVGHASGYRTIQRCKLNRAPLVLRRLAVLEQVEQLLRQAASLADSGARELVLEEARSLANEQAEYTSLVRRYLDHV